MNRLLNNTYVRFVPALAVMAAIFLLSHTPGNNLPSGIAGLDKICHAGAYGVLALSCLIAVSPWHRNKPAPALGIGVILFCLLYGVSDEFHQTFISGRSSEWQDLIADAAGSAFAVFGWLLWRSKREGRGILVS